MLALQHQLEAIHAIETFAASLTPQKGRIQTEIHLIDTLMNSIPVDHRTPALATDDETRLIYGDAAPHSVRLTTWRAPPRTGLYPLITSPEIKALMEWRIPTGQTPSPQRTIQPCCRHCPFVSMMQPALLYREGTLVAHLWVCLECYRTRVPIFTTEGMPLFPEAGEGVTELPLTLSAADTAWHRPGGNPRRNPFRELALRRPHPDGPSAAEDTPVPADDGHPAPTRT